MSHIELVPKPAIVKRIINESNEVKSFILEKEDGSLMDSLPGQFIEISIPGIGESTFAISRLSEDKRCFTVSIKRIGHTTKMLHRLAVGEIIGYRGPYGNHFPIDQWRKKDIVVIAGGIGLAPLRPVIDHLIKNRENYGAIHIIFGARSPQDILFKDDLENWKNDSSVSVTLTIDIPHEGWNGRVGFVPAVVKDLGIKPNDTIALVCGPPIMIKYTAAALEELKWQKDQIFTTLEMKMQCGIGQCGRCNIGSIMICKDGPVFCLNEIPEHSL